MNDENNSLQANASNSNENGNGKVVNPTSLMECQALCKQISNFKLNISHSTNTAGDQIETETNCTQCVVYARYLEDYYRRALNTLYTSCSVLAYKYNNKCRGIELKQRLNSDLLRLKIRPSDYLANRFNKIHINFHHFTQVKCTFIAVKEELTNLIRNASKFDPNDSGFDDDQRCEMSVSSQTQQSVLSNEASTSREKMDDLLLPMNETPLYSIDTESGGKLYKENQKLENQRIIKSRLSCEICLRTFKTYGGLLVHVRVHEPRDTNIKCDVCQKELKSKSGLTLHKRVHRETISCNNCKSKFYNKHELDWHSIECDARHFYDKRRTRSENGIVMKRDLKPDNKRIVKQRRASVYKGNTVKSVVDDWIISNFSTKNQMSDMDKYILKDILKRNGNAKSLKLELDNYSVKSSRKSEYAYSVYSFDDDNSVSMQSFRSYSEVGKANTVKQKGFESRRSSTYQDFDHGYSTNFDMKQEKYIKKMKAKSKKYAANIGITLYPCDYLFCSFSAYTLKKLMEHEMLVHNALPIFHCVECREQFTGSKHLNDHIDSHLPDPHLCVLCDAICENSKEFRLHLELHAIKSYECNLCDMQYLKKNRLENHMKLVHENGQNIKKVLNVCNTCEKFSYIQSSSASEDTAMNSFSRELIQRPSAIPRTRSYFEYKTRLGEVKEKFYSDDMNYFDGIEDAFHQ